jgi:hypothetical protein
MRQSDVREMDACGSSNPRRTPRQTGERPIAL